MSQLVPGSRYGIVPGQYAYDAFANLVNHTDVAPVTIPEYDVQIALEGMVLLGRVALAHDDLGEYRQWEGHVSQFVEALQGRQLGLLPDQYYSDVATMRFLGAAAGDMEAADKLHAMLSNSTEYGLSSIMELCAKHDVMPDGWINRHAETADDRAHAWAKYLYARRAQAEITGEQLTAAGLRTAGSTAYLRDYIAGNLSAEATLELATNAYRLAEDSVEKREIISRFGITISEQVRAADDAGEDLAYADLRKMVDVVRIVACDLTVPDYGALDLADVAEREMPPWDDMATLRDHSKLAIVTAIMRGADLAAVEALIPTYAAHDEQPYGQDEMRDMLLRVAAQTYAGRGEYEVAATALSHIRNTRAWQRGFASYVLAGGDIGLARQADDLQSVAEAVFGASYTPHSTTYDPPQWGARREIATFAANLQRQDYAAAGESLQRMADVIGGYRPRVNDDSRVSDIIFWDCLQRLITRDPASVSIAPKIVAPLKQGRFSCHSAVLGLFAEHGSAEAQRALWEHVASTSGRAVYLAEYAGALLAQNRIKY